ncbi:hypothetical protein FACS189447_10390 [Spirochaetia bacterium]|nr:hypothetical protein FACS189447_10390 [Spirochaetia bacterium]
MINAPAAINGGSFAFGLADGLGYNIIYYICAGVIKHSNSYKAFRLRCVVFFAEYCMVAWLCEHIFTISTIPHHYLAFGIVLVLDLICFLIIPALQKNLFETNWSDGFHLADMVEYAPILAEAEKVDTEKHLDLSPRETEVFTLLLTEAPVKQIAHTLKISYSGVNFHTKNLYRKLGIQSRTELFAKFGKK